MSPPPLYLIPGMSPEFPIYSGIVDLLPGETLTACAARTATAAAAGADPVPA